MLHFKRQLIYKPQKCLRGRPICSRFRWENEQLFCDAKFEPETDALQILSREAYSIEDILRLFYLRIFQKIRKLCHGARYVDLLRAYRRAGSASDAGRRKFALVERGKRHWSDKSAFAVSVLIVE